ncbi:unnamed protein product [Rotaria sordida]|uniref:Uncharacterized protein n=1 Tax=Rotaria sordida TaxID=392033 RepID=A0A819Y0K0_9BILA|nr:unnamed protein product [Rotaria sordida]
MNENWYDQLDEIKLINDGEKPMIALGLISFGVLAPFYVAYRDQQQEEQQKEQQEEQQKEQQEEQQEQSPLNKDEQ